MVSVFFFFLCEVYYKQLKYKISCNLPIIFMVTSEFFVIIISIWLKMIYHIVYK